MVTKFDKWQSVLWTPSTTGSAIAFCPTHKTRLDIVLRTGMVVAQETTISTHSRLVCPVDDESFLISGGSFWTMQRRYLAVKELEQFKNATYRDLDNVYTPVLKVSPKPKDKRYSVQVEIDDTPDGKKMVIYAMDRKNPPEKTQIFIDPELDKISFDATNDLHPNMIFSKVVAYFKDNKSATLEAKD